ncbi:MAG: di-trans,poly-cis-decaprenylcistransferase [Planctomycetaceae bacterium]|nr:di-trans,poly-cis-decaprenylcistransferase [Planctomycetaceae bacterium]|tara:strand:+ start:1522 stop:2289 length:768 start_codon:yes stop_codon:yes gene_type:complete
MSTSIPERFSAPASDSARDPKQSMPRHIAIIMDGNGRWAQQRELPRIEGHRNGVSSVRRTVEECARLEIEQLTLFCLSSENWKRPSHELDFLMHLLEQYMIEERSLLMEQGIRVQVIGRREGIPERVLNEINKTIEITGQNRGTILCLAINYGGRGEISDAVQKIARRIEQGGLTADQVDEQLIAENLYTSGMPDPDLLIRTSGEMRISNFLLWQISYSELWVTDKYWPEFEEDDLHQAMQVYATRNRRFGGLTS